MNDVDASNAERQRSEGDGKSAHRKHLDADPREVTIEVYLLEASDPPRFDVVTTLPTRGGGHNPPIKFQNDHHPGFKITFDFYDQTNGGVGSGYQFASSPTEAVWSKLGTTCPLISASDVFSKPKLIDPTTLQVFNANPDLGNGVGQGDFMYTLNVSISGNPPFVHLDPGGVNMNGSV